MTYLQGMEYSVGGIGTFVVKRNLFGLIKDGYVVSILQNNTVLLVNIKKRLIVDVVTMNCNFSNSTNGDIYIREFYDPFLLLFCEQSSSIFQFIVRG